MISCHGNEKCYIFKFCCQTKNYILIPKNVRTCLAKQGQEESYIKASPVHSCPVLSYILVSPFRKAHKTFTFSFHLRRFAARVLTFAILLHVVFVRNGLLLPSGLHSRAVTQCSYLTFLIIWPIQLHLRRLISSLVLFTPVFSWICWWEMVRCNLFLRILFMYLHWKPSSLFVLSNCTFIFLPISLVSHILRIYRKPV